MSGPMKVSVLVREYPVFMGLGVIGGRRYPSYGEKETVDLIKTVFECDTKVVGPI